MAVTILFIMKIKIVSCKQNDDKLLATEVCRIVVSPGMLVSSCLNVRHTF